MTKEEFKNEYFIYKSENTDNEYEVIKRDALYYEDDDEEISVSVDVEKLKKAILNDDVMLAKHFNNDADEVEMYDYNAEVNAPTVSYYAVNVGVDCRSIYKRILGYYKHSGNWKEFVPLMYEKEEVKNEASDEVYFNIWRTKEDNEPVKDEYGADVYTGKMYKYIETESVFDYVDVI
jgi:hypothetical protein